MSAYDCVVVSSLTPGSSSIRGPWWPVDGYTGLRRRLNAKA